MVSKEFEEVTSPGQPPIEGEQQPPEADETQPSEEGGETPVEGAVEQPEGAAVGDEAPRTFTQEEVSTLQSKLDTQVVELRTQVKALEDRQTQADVARQAETQWAYTQQELATREAQELKEAEDEGRNITSLKREQAIRYQNAQQQIQLQQIHARMGEESKVNTAITLAQQYGIADPKSLLSATSPEHMEAMAKLQQMEAEKVKVETVVAEAKRPAQTFEGAVPSPGEGGGDKAFIKAWGAGDLDSTPENIKRAQKLERQLT